MDKCSIIDLYPMFNLYTKKKHGQCNVESKLKDMESSLIQRKFQPWHHELLWEPLFYV